MRWLSRALGKGAALWGRCRCMQNFTICSEARRARAWEGGMICGAVQVDQRCVWRKAWHGGVHRKWHQTTGAVGMRNGKGQRAATYKAAKGKNSGGSGLGCAEGGIAIEELGGWGCGQGASSGGRAPRPAGCVGLEAGLMDGETHVWGWWRFAERRRTLSCWRAQPRGTRVSAGRGGCRQKCCQASGGPACVRRPQEGVGGRSGELRGAAGSSQSSRRGRGTQAASRCCICVHTQPTWVWRRAVALPERTWLGIPPARHRHSLAWAARHHVEQLRFSGQVRQAGGSRRRGG